MEQDKVAKMPQVKAEVEQLSREIEYCHKSIEELEQRLSNVLHQSPPSEAKQAQPEAKRVPLAEELRKSVGEIKYLGNRITSIRDRIEL